MSYITDVTMVVRDPYPECILEHVQQFSWGNNGELRRVAYFGDLNAKELAGGSKVYCDSVYAAAFNYLPVSDFIQHLEKAPWNPCSRSVVLLSTEGGYYAIFQPSKSLIEEFVE